MSLNFNDLVNLINGSVRTNTTQDVKADILNNLLQELLNYSANHDININRIPNTIARTQVVQTNLATAINDVIGLLHGGNPSDGLTLDGLKALIDALQTQINGTNPPSPIPVGLICMWSGTVIPDKWELCDGGGGRPNLSGKFIVGYHSGTEYGQPGNASDLLHAETSPAASIAGYQGGIPRHTLRVPHLPAHRHEANSAGGASISIASTGGSHSHGTTAAEKKSEGIELHPKAPWPINNRNVTVNDYQSTSATVTGGSHGHPQELFRGNTGDGSNLGISANEAGQATLDNRPLFYTLAYIIKVEE